MTGPWNCLILCQKGKPRWECCPHCVVDTSRAAAEALYLTPPPRRQKSRFVPTVTNNMVDLSNFVYNTRLCGETQPPLRGGGAEDVLNKTNCILETASQQEHLLARRTDDK